MPLTKELILDTVKEVYPEVETYEHRNQLTLIVSREKHGEICTKLRDSEETKFDMLIDITAIDRLRPKDRFEVVYFLYSNKNKEHLRLKVMLDEKDLIIPTISDIWESANWYERETYDMYGVKFEGHPGLRRFYMPEDFKDPETGEKLHPLRKDFPLMGIPDSMPLPPFPERDGEPV